MHGKESRTPTKFSLRFDPVSKALNLENLRVLVFEEGQYFVARGVEISYSSYGLDIEEAKRSFSEGLTSTINAYIRATGNPEAVLEHYPSLEASLSADRLGLEAEEPVVLTTLSLQRHSADQNIRKELESALAALHQAMYELRASGGADHDDCSSVEWSEVLSDSQVADQHHLEL